MFNFAEEDAVILTLGARRLQVRRGLAISEAGRHAIVSLSLSCPVPSRCVLTSGCHSGWQVRVNASVWSRGFSLDTVGVNQVSALPSPLHSHYQNHQSKPHRLPSPTPLFLTHLPLLLTLPAPRCPLPSAAMHRSCQCTTRSGAT